MPAHRAPRRCLRCSSQPPPKPLTAPPLAIQAWTQFHFVLTRSEMFYHRIGHERSQAQDHTMGGLRMGGLRGARLSSAPVLVGVRTADMAQGIERYPFQIHTVRSGLIAWVLSGADVDDTMAWCEALRRAGVKGGVNFEPKRKSSAARARHSLQRLVSPGAQGEVLGLVGQP